MQNDKSNPIPLLLLGFITGTVFGTTLVLGFGDYLPTGFPFSSTERLQWETLLAGATALAGGYMAYRSAIYPLTHRKKQKSSKLALQMLSKHQRTFGAYISWMRNNPNKEEVSIILSKTRTDTVDNVQKLFDYVQTLDLDSDLYSDTAEKYREVMTYALADVLRAEDPERFLRKLRAAEHTSRQFINLFNSEKFELFDTDKRKRSGISA